MSILKYSFGRYDCETIGVAVLNAAYDLSGNAEAFAYADNFVGMFGAEVYLHTVAHVEHFVHLGPVGAAFALDEVKEGRDWEHVVLYDKLVLYKMHHFGLCAAAAVNHAVDFGTHYLQNLFDDRSISACGREHELARI